MSPDDGGEWREMIGNKRKLAVRIEENRHHLEL